MAQDLVEQHLEDDSADTLFINVVLDSSCFHVNTSEGELFFSTLPIALQWCWGRTFKNVAVSREAMIFSEGGSAKSCTLMVNSFRFQRVIT